MINQRILFCFISICCMVSCLTTNKANKSSEKSTSMQMDTSVIAILPHKAISYRKFKDCKAAKLTITDINNIEVILRKCMDEYNPKAEALYNDIKSKNPDSNIDIKRFTLDLKRYKRQYVAATNSKGEKEVWVNCFCRTMNIDWKKHPLFVRDGGNCFFNLKINLTQNRYYELYVNGVS